MRLGDIVIDDHQVRADADDDGIAALAKSIDDEGLLAPLIVRMEGDVAHLVVGERRWRACLSLGWSEVPVRIKTGSAAEVRRAVFAENFHRRDITSVEQASAIKDALDDGTVDEEGIAAGFGRKVEWVRRQVAVMGWPGDVLEAMHVCQLSIAAAAWLSRITDDAYRAFLVRQGVTSGVTARTAEQWFRGWEASRPVEAVSEEVAEPAEPAAGAGVAQSPCMLCGDVNRPDGMSSVLVCVPCLAHLREARSRPMA